MTLSITQTRIESIDLLKGLVMVIMALDHTRDFFHASVLIFDPTDSTKSTLPIFFTRFITHFCAPTFSFLAGVSAYMVGRRKNINELSTFLFTRGLWLVFIELTIVNFGWNFDIQFRNTGLAVIWCLGISMIFLAALIYLPKPLILIFSCLLIFGHNLFDGQHFDNNFLWALLHEGGDFSFWNNYKIYVGYPIVPWIAVMSLGYIFGSLYNSSFDHTKRKIILNSIGISAILLFFILNVTNFYCDSENWIYYETFSKTLMSFLNLAKYPPSLLFLLITLGIAFLFLANTENFKGKIVGFFNVFGRVPFFYYILHLYLIHFLSMIAAEISGYSWHNQIYIDDESFLLGLKGYGFSLWVVYLVWITVIAMLYPLCKWFDKYKTEHKEKWWLSYL